MIYGPKELLSYVHGQNASYEKAKKVYAERIAPDFSPLEFLDTRENGLSRILAWLLDPGGNHAQGPAFLIGFLSWLGVDEEWIHQSSGASVVLEWPVWAEGQQGYVDVLVNIGGKALAIENKPWAEDQPRQVARYLLGMARDFPAGNTLVYLSGKGDGPSESSITEAEAEQASANGKLRVVGYPQLVDWLRECLASCRAPMVALMLEGLERHIQKEFVGVSDSDQATDLATSVLQSQETLAAALTLFETEPLVRKQLISKLVAQVEVEANARGWHIIRADMDNTKDSAIVVGTTEGAEIGLGVQFDGNGYRNLFYGLASEDGRSISQSALYAIQGILGSKDGTEWWPCWKWVNPNDRFFPIARQVDSEFWLTVNDGRFSKMLFSFLDEANISLEAAGVMDFGN